ncbi:MAG: site-specific integrase [Panacagrimonas sp.]
MMRFTLATGLRQRNVCRLGWADVDLARCCAWVPSDQSKTKNAIAVTLNADAMAVLQRREGMHKEFVFTYRGNPVCQVNTKAWRAAVERAGLKDFRWHDLRHTWASWHAQQGTPFNGLAGDGWMEVAGDGPALHAHLTAAHLMPYARRLAGVSAM